eukprot:CAMPEP_0174724344 /NCGR_PEP_ID=MMETSP1094-20130205/43131_1 /TAXON_ID=156173 /ORGANISM="Chrysochromulina brevifilum, Strain UTEX LB 985" /LENGTH=127 /DNA_ID=CAMNT_0015925547 /DNA_START=202 /DNA_END=586 /DNA_ORIENTATION=-
MTLTAPNLQPHCSRPFPLEQLSSRPVPQFPQHSQGSEAARVATPAAAQAEDLGYAKDFGHALGWLGAHSYPMLNAVDLERDLLVAMRIWDGVIGPEDLMELTVSARPSRRCYDAVHGTVFGAPALQP